MTTLKDKVAAWPGNVETLLHGSEYQNYVKAYSIDFDGEGSYEASEKVHEKAPSNAALTILQRECIEELVAACIKHNKAWAMKKAGLIHAKNVQELEYLDSEEFDAWQDVMISIATAQELLTKTKA